jgi:hypothetical protein
MDSVSDKDVDEIPDPHQRILVFFTQNWKLKIKIRDVHPVSWLWIFFPSRIPESKITGSRIRIRNTAFEAYAQKIPGRSKNKI